MRILGWDVPSTSSGTYTTANVSDVISRYQGYTWLDEASTITPGTSSGITTTSTGFWRDVWEEQLSESFGISAREETINDVQLSDLGEWLNVYISYGMMREIIRVKNSFKLKWFIQSRAWRGLSIKEFKRMLGKDVKSSEECFMINLFNEEQNE